MAWIFSQTNINEEQLLSAKNIRKTKLSNNVDFSKVPTSRLGGDFGRIFSLTNLSFEQVLHIFMYNFDGFKTIREISSEDSSYEYILSVILNAFSQCNINLNLNLFPRTEESLKSALRLAVLMRAFL